MNGLKNIEVATTRGDGSGPEIFDVVWPIGVHAARLDGINLISIPAPMGWNEFLKSGDTFPPESLATVLKLKLLFFCGVGDTQYDKTLGDKYPEMKPEGRCILRTRKELGLLINYRPDDYFATLRHIPKIKECFVPKGTMTQHQYRFLLEDDYFGTIDFLARIEEISEQIQGLTGIDKDQCLKVLEAFIKVMGIKLHKEVKLGGNDELITDLAYYRLSSIQKYARFVFTKARELGLPLISVDKSNVSARYMLWRNTFTEIGAKEFPDVKLIHQYSDSAVMLLFTPEKLNAVIASGNKDGDMITDGAGEAAGSAGLMYSSAVNPDNGAAMFESGAGTAPTLAGKNIVNPIGRLLTLALLLEHIGAKKGAHAIRSSVREALESGWCTADLATEQTPHEKILGTREMGEKIFSDPIFRM